MVYESSSLLEAIEKQLVKEHPRLFVQKEIIQQQFTKKSLLVIDDINKQENPSHVLEKIISWMQIEEKSDRNITVLCPVWPRNLALVEQAN